MPKFAPGKFLDFLRYLDLSKPQHVEAFRRLGVSLEEKAPELLTDEAYWVQAYRKQPDPPPKSLSVDISDHVRLQSQSTADSCGQCSAAMVINCLTGKHLTDNDFNYAHHYQLLDGLREECPNYVWEDVGNIGPDKWEGIGQALSRKCPVLVGLNGPLFSHSGRGHIVAIVGLTPTEVKFADPNGGYFRTVLRTDMEQCRDYPQGKFVFQARPR